MSATATATRTTGGSALPPTGKKRPRRSRRREALLVGVIAATLVLLIAAGGWLLLFSSMLSAQRVVVTGTTDLTVEQVQAAAQVPLGRPLARQDLATIAQRTTQLPQVAQARVSRNWPDAIDIVVTERRPVLAVAQPQGFVLVDPTGVAYETRRTVPAGVQQVDVDPGNAPLLFRVAEVSAALPDSLRSKVDRIAANNEDNIVLRLDSKVVVTWGSSAESALKVEITEALLKRKPRSTIDVSSPHNPAFR
jgi:cell division protein FtsQ